MSLRQTSLLIVIILLASLGIAVFMHPDGADGVRSMLGLSGAAASETSANVAADPSLSKAQLSKRQLTYGDDAYDMGKFGEAVTFYGVASITDDLRQRDAAQRGQQRAVLAWAVIQESVEPDYAGKTSDDRWAELLGKAGVEGSEDAWLEAVLFASGAGRGEDLPEAVDALFEVVRTGGAVEKRLQNVLRSRTTNQRQLAAAMTAIGLDNGAAAGGMFADLGHDSASPGEESGIGGTNRRPGGVSIPYGEFPSAFMPRLREAAEAEAKGMELALAAGPDGENRTENRREAIRLLTIARDVYNEGLEEHDPDSVELQKHYSKVIEALSLLRKSSVVGD